MTSFRQIRVLLSIGLLLITGGFLPSCSSRDAGDGSNRERLPAPSDADYVAAALKSCGFKIVDSLSTDPNEIKSAQITREGVEIIEESLQEKRTCALKNILDDIEITVSVDGRQVTLTPDKFAESIALTAQEISEGDDNLARAILVIMREPLGVARRSNLDGNSRISALQAVMIEYLLLNIVDVVNGERLALLPEQVIENPPAWQFWAAYPACASRSSSETRQKLKQAIAGLGGLGIGGSILIAIACPPLAPVALFSGGLILVMTYTFQVSLTLQERLEYNWRGKLTDYPYDPYKNTSPGSTGQGNQRNRFEDKDRKEPLTPMDQDGGRGYVHSPAVDLQPGDLIGHTVEVTCVTFSPDGRYALSGGRDKTMRLWDLTTGMEQRRFEHGDIVYDVHFIQNGRYALSAGLGQSIKIWDVNSGQVIRTFDGANGLGYATVAVSKDSRYGLCADSFNHLVLWDIENNIVVRKFGEHEHTVRSVAFSPDGRYALSGTTVCMKLWDVNTGTELRVFDGHENRLGSSIWSHKGDVNSVAFSPDGRFALSGSWDESVKLWDVETGAEIWKFTGHFRPVKCVAFSPDGRYAVSGSVDKMIRFLDVNTGEELLCIKAHSLDVEAVAFSPDGRYVLSGGGHMGELKLWKFEL